MTQENHNKAEQFLKNKYPTENENSKFGWNELISILAEYTDQIKNSLSSNPKWIKCSDGLPNIGDYYFVRIDTKKDNVLETIIEWGKFPNGNYNWDFKNVAHFGTEIDDEGSEVIEWLQTT